MWATGQRTKAGRLTLKGHTYVYSIVRIRNRQMETGNMPSFSCQNRILWSEQYYCMIGVLNAHPLYRPSLVFVDRSFVCAVIKLRCNKIAAYLEICV